MKENTSTYSWSGKIHLTYPPDRCMNKFLPISLFDLLYSRLILRLWGSLYTKRSKLPDKKHKLNSQIKVPGAPGIPGDGALAKQLEPLAIPGRYPQRMIGALGAGS